MQYITEGNDGFMFDVGSLYHWLEGLADWRHRRGKRYPPTHRSDNDYFGQTRW